MYPDSLTRWNWLGFSPYAPARTPRQASLQDVRLWMPVCVSAKRSIRIVDGVGPAVVVGFRLHLKIAERRAAADLAGIFKLAFLCGPVPTTSISSSIDHHGKFRRNGRRVRDHSRIRPKS